MGGSGWKTKEAADTYKAVIDFIVPGRRDILDTIARIATEFKQGGLRFLDIGSGHGDVAAEILKRRPEAYAMLVDYSESMVLSAKQRFSGNERVNVLRHDLNNGLPKMPYETFDTVVSCFAIHHIEYDNRMTLYRCIYDMLEPGAFFICGDMFKGDSPVMDDWEFDNWVAWMVAGFKDHLGEEHTFEDIKRRQLESFEKMGDKPGTIWDMYSDLKSAGFEHVDCMLKTLNLAVLVAAK
jgi:tRNA (cmo5U34)-methyltransferase